MRFTAIGSIVLAFAAGVMAPRLVEKIDARAHPKPAHSTFWLERVEGFSTFKPAADVVFIGDSLTDRAEWAEIFPGVHVANRGLSGDDTAGLLQRLDGIPMARKSFLMIGINDLSRGVSVDEVFANYTKIVAALPGEVYVQSTIECNARLDAGCPLANVRSLNARLRTLPNFIDLNASMSDADGLKAIYTLDGVHLNAAGYMAWRDAISAHVR